MHINGTWGHVSKSAVDVDLLINPMVTPDGQRKTTIKAKRAGCLSLTLTLTHKAHRRKADACHRVIEGGRPQNLQTRSNPPTQHLIPRSVTEPVLASAYSANITHIPETLKPQHPPESTKNTHQPMSPPQHTLTRPSQARPLGRLHQEKAHQNFQQ